MLPRNSRLRAAEVAAINKTGASVRGRFLSAKVTRKAAGGERRGGTIRAASVVSKSLAKTAIKRNRFRRALYAALAQASIPANLHAVLFLRVIPEEPLVPAFRADIEEILKRFGAKK